MSVGKKRYISTTMRDDSFFIELDPIEKLLFVYLLSNPLTNVAGIYEISIRRIAFDTGIDNEMVLKILKRFENKKKVLYVDGYIILVNSHKHQNIDNSKIQKGIKRILDSLPQSLIDKIGPIYNSSMTYIGPSNNLDSDLDSDSDLNSNLDIYTPPKKKKTRAIKYHIEFKKGLGITNTQYDKLMKDYYKKDVDNMLLELENYIINNPKGKGIKDCNLAIRNWLNRKGVSKKSKQDKQSTPLKTDSFFTSITKEIGQL